MSVTQITIDTTGQIGVNPRIVKVVCNDSLSDVTTAGFLTNSSLSGLGSIIATDMVLVSYSGGIGFFEPSIASDGVITLSASLAIPDGSVGTAELAALAVTTAKIALLAVDTAQLAANAVTTAKITDANVTLAKLSAGISPSHIIKFAGKFSNGGGSPTITITGLTGMDPTTFIGFAQIQASTNAVTVQKVTPGVNQMVVLLSGDPGASTVLSYQALVPAQ
jgi:hypothetical protein